MATLIRAQQCNAVTTRGNRCKNSCLKSYCSTHRGYRRKTRVSKPRKAALTTSEKRARDFRYWTKSAGLRPFAKGSIPSEAETAPGLDEMFKSMEDTYVEGRSVFYAKLRKISPVSKLMRIVLSILKKIGRAKRGNRSSTATRLRRRLSSIKQHVKRFESAREIRDWKAAAKHLKKAESYSA